VRESGLAAGPAARTQQAGLPSDFALSAVAAGLQSGMPLEPAGVEPQAEHSPLPAAGLAESRSWALRREGQALQAPPLRASLPRARPAVDRTERQV